MYWNILKKDLKRKVTMNVILFLFIVLATMFVSSSVNNIITASSALEDFFDKAKLPDYLVGTTSIEGKQSLEEALKEVPGITSKKIEKLVYFNSDQVKVNGKKTEMQGPVLTYFENRGIEFFDENNQQITDLKEGELLLPVKYMKSNDIKKGDKVEITFQKTTVVLSVAGGVKDAVMGSAMMSMERFLVSKADFDLLMKTPGNVTEGELGYLNCKDVSAVKTALSKVDINIAFNGTKKLIRQTYVLDIIVSIALFILSVCLILIAFVVLSFTIRVTLEEEFREIGVMKAIGLPQKSIRGLYLVKYFVMAFIGAGVGMIAGIPFGEALLETSSRTIVMENVYGYGVYMISAIFVVVIVVWYCYYCTGKLKKFSPIDAIRNGSNGERYQKKGVFSLSKSRFTPVQFLTVNDIFSNLKRYGVMIVTFTIGLIVILVIVNTVNTMQGDNILNLYGMAKSDVFIRDEGDAYQYIIKEDGQTQSQKRMEQIKKKVEKKDMPCEIGMEVYFKFTYKKGDKSYKSTSFMGVNQKTTDYDYIKGEAPMAVDEVAITPLVAEEIGAEIGDTITMITAEGKHKVIVTGIFQTFSNMGEGVRLHPDLTLNFMQVVGCVGYQIVFKDSPDQREIDKRVKDIQKMYPKSQVYNCSDFINYYNGGTTDMIDAVRMIFVAVSIVICLLVVILMERSFVAREKSEIALLKALGFRNSTLICWHTLRIGVVMMISIIIGEILALPISQLTAGQAFKNMGAQSVDFEIIPMEVFGVYPGILLLVTVMGGYFVAQCIRKIPASEAATME